ncbi:MAG: formylglycine-generating enzyme family protein [Candidatus Cloacimonetes bacterium]|jgi:formylglycine-generating enzyme required for sulfatase activity|nr:formylglycine-generating enzyme family protein [Candidatus Cloacimonadota bacterium]
MRRRNSVTQDAALAKDNHHQNDVAAKFYIPRFISRHISQERRPALRKLPALLLLLILLSCSLFAETVLHQGFESSPADTWNYTAIPAPNRAVWWGATNQILGGASAQSGDWYWASWDLDNQSHTLEFDSVQLSPNYIYTLSFYYYSKNLIPATDINRYCLEYDSGETWSNWQNLQPDTNAWTCLSVGIPAYSTTLRFKVEALYDGFAKYAHWDAFSLERIAAPPLAPNVSNVSAVQRTDGSKIVDIYYDIYDANADPATVSVMLSENSGASFEYHPALANLSGDLGADITSGTAKHIVWNAGAEGIDFDDSTFRIRVLAEDHTLMGIVASPVFSPAGGISSPSQQISITCATAAANIYYSTDGSDPDEDSTLYTAPLSFSVTTTLKARAYKEFWEPSGISSAVYTISDNFILVEGGSFHNGASDVTLSSFYLDKYQLTQAGYRLVMGRNPSHDYGVGADYPAYYFSWLDALEYCNRRSMQEGLMPCYSYGTYGTDPDNWPRFWNESSGNHYNASCNWNANGYRMPTDMEWMFAARGGNQTHDYIYSGGNDLDLVGWYLGNDITSTTKPVGLKAPNELGFYDMSGNVWELCWDINGPLPTTPQINPHVDFGGNGRVSRGGQFINIPEFCTVTFRNFSYCTDRSPGLGLRVCRNAPR